MRVYAVKGGKVLIIKNKTVEHTDIQKMISHGGISFKLSFLIMGWCNLVKKQFAKGIIFLGTEIAFFWWMVSKGIRSIKNFLTLGTETQGWQFDDELGINLLKKGDNSMILMIYGIAAIMTIILFLCLYWVNIKSAANLYILEREGKQAPSFREDLIDLLDKKFHVTLMGIPMAGVVLFTILPLVYMILLAFTSYDHDHLPPKHLFDWIGLANFGNIFTGRMSETFLPLLGWTLIWAVFATATTFFFGIILALLINTKGVKGKKIFRTLFVLTMAMPQFVSLLLMQNLLHASGPVNALLMNIGLIQNPLPFLTSGLWAKVSVIFVNMWIGIPVTMLVSTGIIMNLPEEQIEAARIDGAGSIQIFRNITFPQIMFVMAPTLIQQFIGNINNFNVIYLLTGGGPFNSSYYVAGETDLLVTWLYKLTVESADYNLAAAIGIVTFVLSAVFSLLAYTRTNSYNRGGEA